jgi:hypothetical protein
MTFDPNYLLSRAVEEDALAAAADNAFAEEAHRRLAEYYREAATNRVERALRAQSFGFQTLTILPRKH